MESIPWVRCASDMLNRAMNWTTTGCTTNIFEKRKTITNTNTFKNRKTLGQLRRSCHNVTKRKPNNVFAGIFVCFLLIFHLANNRGVFSRILVVCPPEKWQKVQPGVLPCSGVLISQFSRSETTEVFGPKPGMIVQAAVSCSTPLMVRKLTRSDVAPNFEKEKST